MMNQAQLSVDVVTIITVDKRVYVRARVFDQAAHGVVDAPRVSDDGWDIRPKRNKKRAYEGYQR
jgi:hypothetical protein